MDTTLYICHSPSYYVHSERYFVPYLGETSKTLVTLHTLDASAYQCQYDFLQLRHVLLELGVIELLALSLSSQHINHNSASIEAKPISRKKTTARDTRRAARRQGLHR
jgi:hypothetical protein